MICMNNVITKKIGPISFKKIIRNRDHRHNLALKYKQNGTNLGKLQINKQQEKEHAFYKLL